MSSNNEQRAVIYVESGTSLRSSTTTMLEKSASNIVPHHPGSNYVIKIQIGEEPMLGLMSHPVRIDVSSTSGRPLVSLKQKVEQHHNCPCEGESSSSSSGQSSPRSDMTPPPRMNINLGGSSGGNRFGSENSESDTESDISAEFRPLSCQAAQFALREICEADSPSPPLLPRSIMKKVVKVDSGEDDKIAVPPPLPESKAPIMPPPPAQLDGQVDQIRTVQNTAAPVVNATVTESSARQQEPPTNILGAIMTLSESMALKRAQKAAAEAVLEHQTGKQSFATHKVVVMDESGFHVNEMVGFSRSPASLTPNNKGATKDAAAEESLSNFAGVRDIFSRRAGEGTKQILSDRGTIRGVKNRVRDGIATFLQSKDTKTYSEKEQGRVVVYTTSMGVVRATFLRCQKVKQILRNLLVKFDERDCYMNRSIQNEIRNRLPNQMLALPQVFLEGQLLGDADAIEKLNETGELRDLLKPYKSLSVLSTCEKCGGFRMLPCQICNGSKKSVHRNHFTTEFIALKCMHCDPSGLVRCDLCNSPDP